MLTLQNALDAGERLGLTDKVDCVNHLLSYTCYLYDNRATREMVSRFKRDCRRHGVQFSRACGHAVHKGQGICSTCNTIYTLEEE